MKKKGLKAVDSCHRGWGLGGGLGTPVVSYAPRPMLLQGGIPGNHKTKEDGCDEWKPSAEGEFWCDKVKRSLRTGRLCLRAKGQDCRVGDRGCEISPVILGCFGRAEEAKSYRHRSLGTKRDTGRGSCRKDRTFSRL